MAGNLVSVIALTTKGRGGYVKETLPKSNKKFCLKRTNARFRCNKCGSVLPITYSQAHKQECPVCFQKNCIVSIRDEKLVLYRSNGDKKNHGDFKKRVNKAMVKKDIFENVMKMCDNGNKPLFKKQICRALGISVAVLNKAPNEVKKCFKSYYINKEQVKAEIKAIIQQNPKISKNKLAKDVGCSYASVVKLYNEVKDELDIAKEEVKFKFDDSKLLKLVKRSLIISMLSEYDEDEIIEMLGINKVKYKELFDEFMNDKLTFKFTREEVERINSDN